MRLEYPVPADEHSFQDFCLRFFRHVEERQGLVPYGKRGEKQDGIDLIDQWAMNPQIAVQCKRHEPHKKIAPASIRTEVKNAEVSKHPIDRYIIATTARKSTESTDVVLELNRRKPPEKKFTVEILFWDDLCTRLAEYDRAIAESIIYGQGMPAAKISPGDHAASTATSLATASGPTLHDNIDALFRQRKIEAAEHEINKLPQPERNSSLSVDERYAILRLQAKLALEKQDYDEAARLFILAYETKPNDERAQTNRVLALDLLGKRSDAFEAACKLVEGGHSTAALYTQLVRTAPSETALSPYIDAIRTEGKSSEEVSFTLAYAALGWNNAQLARESAELALRADPQSAHAYFIRGMVNHHEVTHGDWARRTENAKAAIADYEQAESAARRDKQDGLLTEVLCNRARTHAALGELGKAASDYHAVLRAAKSPAVYAPDAMSFFLLAEEYDAAEAALAFLPSNSEDHDYFSVALKFATTKDDDRIEAIEGLAAIARTTGRRSREATINGVQGAIDAKKYDLAASCITDEFVEHHPLVGNTLRGWIAWEQGDKIAAGDLAAKALDSPSTESHPLELELLARLLMALSRREQALPLLERVYTPGVLDNDCKMLLACAEHLQRHDVVLRITQELEKTGQSDRALQRMRIRLLLRYAPDQAYDLAGKSLEVDRSYYLAVRNFINASSGKADQIVIDGWRLPEVRDLAPEEAALVVTPLATKKRWLEALDYLYHSLRFHYESEKAHAGYITFFLMHAADIPVPRTPRVAEDTAVCLRNGATRTDRWVVLESDAPEPSRFEFAPSDPAVSTLVGKKPGDVIDRYDGRGAVDLPEEIVEVVSKYVYRLADTRDRFAERFPKSTVLLSVHVGSGDDFDPSPLVAFAKQRSESVDHSLDYYQNNPCALHLLAERLGIDVRRVMVALAWREESQIHCVDLTMDRYDEAVEQASKAETIVLDISAIVTLSRLGLWDNLDPAKKLVVPHTTAASIRSWVAEARGQTGVNRSTLHYAGDGKIALTEQTDEERQSEIEETEAILKAVNERCETGAALSSVDIEPHRRELYEEVLGVATLDSVTLAQQLDAPLWTDARLEATVAEVDFGVTRLWTQAVLQAACDAGRLSRDPFSLANARLLEWGYVSTRWVARDLIAAGREAEWDTREVLFSRSLKVLGSPLTRIAIRRNVVIEFLKLFRNEECHELQHTAVVQAVLNAMDHTAATNWMRQRVDAIFGTDVTWADFVADQLDYWLRLRAT